MRKVSALFSILILGSSLILGFQNCSRGGGGEEPGPPLNSNAPPPVDLPVDDPIGDQLGAVSALIESTSANSGTTVEELSADISLLQELLNQLNALDPSGLTPEQQAQRLQLIQAIQDLIAKLQAELDALNASGPAACSLNGLVIASGDSVIAYQNASVPFGGSCVQESRTCTDGSLSGSYIFSACTVGDPEVVCSLQPYTANGAPVCVLPDGKKHSATLLGINSVTKDQCSALCANEGKGSQCFFYSISTVGACYSCEAGSELTGKGGLPYSGFKAICE